MTLTRYKLGDLIRIVDKKNVYGKEYPFFGINKNKEFMPTMANIENLKPKNYSVLEKGDFLFSGMQTGRDKCIRIGLYQSDDKVLISSAYTIFNVIRPEIVNEQYLFMMFLSQEMDRYGWFLSDSSVRSNLDWDRFIDIEVALPPIEIQQKYVDIYNGMNENIEAYETGLEDLKLVCDAYVEKLIHKSKLHRLGSYIERKSNRNNENKILNVKGLSTSKQFREVTSRVDKNKISNYKIVGYNEFAFVPTTDTWKVFANALNKDPEQLVVSPIYEVFSVNETKLVPEYLKIIFDRKEFDRYARFHSWGSARETFTWDDLCNVMIPIPTIEIQQDIADIYNIYNERKRIAKELKELQSNMCPILIKGAVEEARS